VIIPLSEARTLRRALLAWYRTGRRDLPWRRTRDPYRIWISEIMLQQTTVGAVVPYYRRFVRAFPTVRALAAARLDDVLAAWSGLGYYRRARHLHQAARVVVHRHRGRFPRRLEEALALPGIGRYTAGAVLSIAFSERLPVVDGNVARVLSRLLLMRGPHSAARQKRLWSAAADLAAGAASPGDLNQALMELGATLCAPRDPACGVCPVARLCAARAAGLEGKIPPPRRARRPVEVRSAVALVARGGRFLLRRRKDGTLMPGLWEFPAAGPGGAGGGLRLHVRRPVATIRHSITYRRFRISVHPARLLSEPPRGRYRWVAPADVRRLPTSAIVRKVLAALPEAD
jgi:A/G-specific adenine glycosylase